VKVVCKITSRRFLSVSLSLLLSFEWAAELLINTISLDSLCCSGDAYYDSLSCDPCYLMAILSYYYLIFLTPYILGLR